MSRRRSAASAPRRSRMSNRFQINIKTKGRLTRPRNSPASFCAPIPTAPSFRVDDVARVEMGARSQDRYSRFNGAPAAAIGIYQSPGSNAVEVAKQVRDTMNTLATRFPPILPITCFSIPPCS